MSLSSAALLLLLSVAPQVFAPIDPYLVVGFGSPLTAARAKFPKLVEHDKGEWCQRDGAATTCLVYGASGLERADLHFLQKVTVAKTLLSKWGPGEITTAGDLTTYTWRRSALVIRLVQRVAAADVMPTEPQSLRLEVSRDAAPPTDAGTRP